VISRRREREFDEAYRNFMQERLDLQNEQLRELKDSLAEWRRLYKKQFDMVQTELRNLNGWVATIAASHNLELPAGIQFDTEAALSELDDAERREGLTDDGVGYDPDEMHIDALLNSIYNPEGEDQDAGEVPGE
jgi:hypothetical protein